MPDPRDTLRAAGGAQRDAGPALANLDQPADPQIRTYVGLVTGLGPGVRVQGPIVVRTVPVLGIEGTPYAGAPLNFRLDDGREELVDLVGGYASDGDPLIAHQDQGRWIAHRWGSTSTDPCPDKKNTLCVHVYSWEAYCLWVKAVRDHPTSPPPLPELGLAATVTIDKTPHLADGSATTDWTTVASGPTDEHGRFCVDLPVLVADPTAPPTVDPTGGGSSGGHLGPGRFQVAYERTNHFGQTRLSPRSAAFTAGTPNPAANPLMPTPTVDPTGGGAAGGTLAPGDYYAVYTLNDAPGTHHTGLSVASARFTVAAGTIPRITLPDAATLASLRPAATGYDIYLCDSSGGFPTNDWRKNNPAAVPATAGHYDVLTPYDPNTQVGPAGNTFPVGIPRVTIPGVGAGTLADPVWIFTAPEGDPTPRRNSIATANPWDLPNAPPAGAAVPTVTNTTGFGYFRAKVEVAGCPPRWLGIAIRVGVCATYNLATGFCCYTDCVTVTDSEDGSVPGGVEWDGVPSQGGPDPAAVANIVPTPDLCFHPAEPNPKTAPGCLNTRNSCTDGEPSGTLPPALVPPTPVLDTTLGYLIPGPPDCISPLHPPRPIVHNYRLRKRPDYYDRCFGLYADCGVPAKTNSGAATLYPADKYVAYWCCGSCGTPAKGTTPDPFAPVSGTDRPPYLLKKRLLATLQGPQALFGQYAGVQIPVNWDPATYWGGNDQDLAAYIACLQSFPPGAYPGCVIVYDSGCLAAGVAKGSCDKNGLCSYDHAGDCGPFSPSRQDVSPFAYFDKYVAYQSCRLRIYLGLGSVLDQLDPLSGHGCMPVVATWTNYWAGGCPDNDPPPKCDPADPNSPVALGKVPCAYWDCNCSATFPAGKQWIWLDYPTKDWSISDGLFKHSVMRGSICAPTDLYMELPYYWSGGYTPFPPDGYQYIDPACNFLTSLSLVEEP